MKYILGVDGGGTRTRALLVDEAGRVLGCGIGGPANFHSVGIEQAVRNIRDAMLEAMQGRNYSLTTIPEQGDPGAVTEGVHTSCIKNTLITTSPTSGSLSCLERSKQADRHIARVVLGLAGVGRAADHRKMLSPLYEGLHDLINPNDMTDLSEVITLTTDAHVALVGAVGGSDGVVVIAGTGAIALGMREGRLERAGGWGYLLDDRGSGYDLGRQAIMAALRDFDGRGQQTILTESICRHLHLTEITDLVGPVHNGELNRAQIGDLAALVVEAAESGDPVAQEILSEGGRELARMALAVTRRLGLSGRFKVAGTGGVLTRQVAFLYPTFVAEIQREHPEGMVGSADLEPVYGAVLLGAQQLGLPIQPMIRRWNDGNEVKPGEAT